MWLLALTGLVGELRDLSRWCGSGTQWVT